jgi:hypothetical protein
MGRSKDASYADRGKRLGVKVKARKSENQMVRRREGEGFADGGHRI